MRRLREWRANLSPDAVFMVTFAVPFVFWATEVSLLQNDLPDAAQNWRLLMVPVYIVVTWFNLGRRPVEQELRKENLREAVDDFLKGHEHAHDVEGQVTLPVEKVRALVLAAQAVTDRRGW